MTLCQCCYHNIKLLEMIYLFKIYWLPVAVLFVVFFDELFNSTAIVRGFTVDTGMKQYEALLLSGIGYSLMIYDFLKGKIKKREYQSLVVLFSILFLYLLTPLFYSNPAEKHITYMLVFGSECIPAAYIGIRLAKSKYIHRINDLLPFVVIPISILVGTIGYAAAMMGKTVGASEYQQGGETGLNYQTLSYFMAFSYTYAFYYALYVKKAGLINILLRFAMVADLFFCAAVCLMSGGRGAFVYIVCITLFMLFYILKSSKNHRVLAIIIIVLFAIVFLYIFTTLGIMQTNGMERVTGRLMEDNVRKELYATAFDAFLSSPIFGCGVGSIWWTVGFYCHNMALDLLAETGMVGTLFFLIVIVRSIIKLYKLSSSDKIFLFFLLVMTGEMANCFFSGYYIAAYKLYFVCSLVYCLPKNDYLKRVKMQRTHKS